MRLAIIMAVALALAACGKSDKKEKPSEPEAKPTEVKKDKPAEPKPTEGPVTLDKFNLKMDAPAGTKVGTGVGGDGYLVQGPNLVVSVDVASDMRPDTPEKAQEEADMYTPQNLKVEKLDDGWLMTFENKGGMGTNYWVQSRLEIGGKAYWCETTATTPEQQANAVTSCKSLRP